MDAARTRATVALTIAGSDPSGGAGLQADLKTFHQHGVYGAAVVTLITVQNTVGVRAVQPLDASLVAAQIDAVLDDLAVSAVKTGALGQASIVRAVAECMKRRPGVTLIVDPVMVSKHGAPLLAEDAVEAFVRELLPRADLVTPNAPEAAALAGMRSVDDAAGARAAARAIVAKGARAVLVKGGHIDAGDFAVDLLLERDGAVRELTSPRVRTEHTHGTGCTLSAAIAAGVARGLPLHGAVRSAKAYLQRALERGPGCEGHGIGPVDHRAPAW